MTRVPLAGIAVILSALHVSAQTPCRGIRQCDTLALSAMGAPVGTMTECMLADSQGFTEHTRLDASIPDQVSGGGSQKLAVEETRVYGSDGAIVSARQSIVSASGANSWELLRRGRKWYVRQLTGGVASEHALAAAPTDRVDNVCRLYRGMRDKTLKAGQSWRDTTCELTTGQLMTSSTVCRASPSQANGYTWEFAATDSYTAREERWVCDSSGRTLFRSLPPFFEGRSRGYAGVDTAGAEPRAITDMLLIPATRTVADSELLELRLDSGATLPQSGSTFYRQDAGAYALKELVVSCAPRSLAPWRAADTASTATLQASHARIRALADSIAPRAADLCALVAAANAHVCHRLRKQTTATFSSALETLTSGFGDCGEHAVLLAALLRARGLPAHVVVGLVYMADRQAYMGHAWVGLKMSSGWLFADPSFNRFPATAGLVPLLVDDSGQGSMEILKLVDRIHISARARPKR